MQWQPIPVELGDDNSLLNEGLFVPCSPDDILTLVIEDDTTVDLGMDEVFADNWFEALVGPDLAEVTDDSSSEESSLLMSLSSLDDISLGFSLDDASEASDLSEEEQDAEPPSTTVGKLLSSASLAFHFTKFLVAHHGAFHCCNRCYHSAF